METPAPETYLKVPQAAERLEMHPETVRRFIREGRIPAAKLGRDYRIAASTIEKVLSGEIDVTKQNTGG